MTEENKIEIWEATITLQAKKSVPTPVLPPPPPAGPTWYVDSTEGDDGENGLTPTTAWKTLGKAQSARTWLAGDALLLARGSLWREQFDVPSSGTLEKKILIGAYGTGARPIIQGSRSIANWTSLGGSKWQATIFFTPVWALFVFPDGSIKWGNKKTSLSALTGDLDFYVAPGVLNVFSAENPSTRFAGVEGTDKNFGVYSGTPGKDYIRVEGIECRFQRHTGIRTAGGGVGWEIVDNHLHHIGATDESNGHGFYGQGGNCLLKSNRIWECGQHGTFFYAASGIPVTDVLIEDNEVFDIWHSGIDFVCTNAQLSDVIIRRNKVFFTNPAVRNGSESYHIEGGSSFPARNIKFLNNEAISTKGIGFMIGGDVVGVEVAYNTVMHGVTEGILIFNEYDDVWVHHNIIQMQNGIPIRATKIEGVIVENNTIL